MMHNDDIQLINSILSGNVRDYAILVNRHKDLAYTIAYRMLNNREDAEEVTQDAFVKAYRHLSSFRKDSAFTTWLYRIVFNAAVSRKRLKKPVFQNIEDLPSSGEVSEIPKYDFDAHAERGHMLEKAMQKLSEEDRVLITLFYINESNIDEIHTITGLSKSNVKVKLFRARKKLQEHIGYMTEKIYM